MGFIACFFVLVHLPGSNLSFLPTSSNRRLFTKRPGENDSLFDRFPVLTEMKSLLKRWIPISIPKVQIKFVPKYPTTTKPRTILPASYEVPPGVRPIPIQGTYQVPTTTFQVPPAIYQGPGQAIPSSYYQGPPINNQLLSTSYKLPSVSYQVAPTSYEVPSTGYKIPSVSYQVAHTSYEVPSTSYKIPSTSYKIPPVSYQIGHTSYEVPSTSYKIPSTGYKIPSTNYKIPPVSYQVAPTSYEVPSTSYKIPSVSYQVAPTTYELPSTGYKVPSVVYQVSSSNELGNSYSYWPTNPYLSQSFGYQSPSPTYGPPLPNAIILTGGQIEETIDSNTVNIEADTQYFENLDASMTSPTVNAIYSVPQSMPQGIPNSSEEIQVTVGKRPLMPCKHNHHFKPSQLLDISTSDSNTVTGFTTQINNNNNGYYFSKPQNQDNENMEYSLVEQTANYGSDENIIQRPINTHSHFSVFEENQINPSFSDGVYQLGEINNLNNFNANNFQSNTFENDVMTSNIKDHNEKHKHHKYHNIIFPQQQDILSNSQLISVSSGYDTFSEGKHHPSLTGASAPIHAASFWAHPSLLAETRIRGYVTPVFDGKSKTMLIPVSRFPPKRQQKWKPSKSKNASRRGWLRPWG